MRARTMLAIAPMILVCTWAVEVAGQSLLREDGQSGPSAATTFFSSTQVRGLSAEAGWNGWGRLDVVAGFAQKNFDPLTWTTAALTEHQIGLQVFGLPIKQSASIPLSVQLGVGYSLLVYSGDAFTGLDAGGHAPMAQMAVAHRIDLGTNLALVPAVEFQYAHGKFTIKAGGEEVGWDETYARVWSCALNLVSHGDVYLAPRVDLSDGDTAVYALTAGFLFPHRR